MRKRVVLALVIASFAVPGIASAFVLTSPFDIFGGTLALNRGEARELTYYLQVSPGEGDAVEIEILSGNDIVTLNGPNVVSVAPGTVTPVDFTVQLPEHAGYGRIYNVEIVFRNIDTTGTSNIRISILSRFNVTVVNPHRR